MARVQEQLSSTDSMFHGVVFDLDGVIVDSHPLHKRAWREFLAYIGKEIAEADLEFILEGRRRREILVHFLGELSESEIKEYGRRKDEFLRQGSTDLKPVCGSVEFIRSLKEIELCMGVATSASQQRARWTLQHLGVADCFDVVVSGDEVQVGKPDPAIYLLAANRLSLSPESLLSIEDSVSGVRSAKLAGFRCIGIAAEESSRPLLQAGADYVVPNLLNLSIRDLWEMFSVRTVPGWPA
jgi:HAD superfamily hydrolase (TIGR01509 family)